MISDVLAEIRKDPSWELCLEANNERVEKVGQWRGPRYDRPNSTYLVQFWQNNLVSRVRFLDYEIQRSAVRPQNWYENPTKNPKLESVSSQQGIRLKENQACPPLREWPDCCVEFVATGPSLEKGRDFVRWRSTGLRGALRHIWNKHGRIDNPRSISLHELSSRTLWERTGEALIA